MEALISKNEIVFDPNTNQELGWRIAQVSEQTFDVCKPLFWITCSNNVQADLWYYDPSDSQVKETPQPIIPDDSSQPSVEGAQTL